MSKSVCIVIPVKNEAATIGAVITGARNEIERLGHRLAGIVVVDDSTDDTRAIARGLGAHVIGGGGRGLGHAMWKGLKTSLKFHPDVILSLDSDGQTDLTEIAKFIAPVESDSADLVLGSRFLEKSHVRYKYPLIKRMGTIILVRIIRGVTRLPITDSHGGIRAMAPNVVRDLEMIGSHTYVQETIIDAHEKGYRVIEIPSAWEPRRFGRSRVVSSIVIYVSYTLPVLVIRSGQHIKFLFPLGVFLIFLAFLDFTIVGCQTAFHLHRMFDRQSFHLILLLVSTGLNLFFFGITLELISGMFRRLRQFDL